MSFGWFVGLLLRRGRRRPPDKGSRGDDAVLNSFDDGPTITPLLVAELLAEADRMPVCVHVIDHPDARVLVDTGMTELHPGFADMDPRLRPLSGQDFDLDGIDIVVNTHLHGDHCGGNHLFAGKPIYVQRRELDDPHTEGQLRVRALDPELVWLAHEHEPGRPRTD